MREIKFKYVFKDGSGKYHMLTQNIEEVEVWNDIRTNIIKGWTIVDRLQYTGLKDKNDKEIYEGDILKHEHPEVSLLKVVYARGGFNVVGIRLEEPLSDLLTPDNGLYRESKVIGNIYENPELLEG